MVLLILTLVVGVNTLLFDTVCMLERVHDTSGVNVEGGDLEGLDNALTVHGELVVEVHWLKSGVFEIVAKELDVILFVLDIVSEGLDTELDVILFVLDTVSDPLGILLTPRVAIFVAVPFTEPRRI